MNKEFFLKEEKKSNYWQTDGQSKTKLYVKNNSIFNFDTISLLSKKLWKSEEKHQKYVKKNEKLSVLSSLNIQKKLRTTGHLILILSFIKILKICISLTPNMATLLMCSTPLYSSLRQKTFHLFFTHNR